jgi:Xaa-Pro aminopeptidase
MPDIHAARRARVRAALEEKRVDAVLFTRLVNVRYLTGFTGSNGALLMTSDHEVLATDGRYTTQAGRQAPDVEAHITAEVTGDLIARALQGDARRIGFEGHDVTMELYAQLAKAAGVAELTPVGRLVERHRVVKDEDEIDLIRRACAIADAALAELLPTISAGRTERDVAWDLEARMRALGADGPSFETIAACGPNSAVPHHRPTEREIARGDFLKLDFGALVEGYHSDMTRTVVVGPPADWQREVYDVVARSQQAGVAALVVGAVGGDVDTVSRDVIEAAGYGDQYTHSLGHGVGLEIHEAPSLRSGGSDTLAARTPVTVEPGVYIPDRGGVRIEDLLVVREGAAENLTLTTKELLVL